MTTEEHQRLKDQVVEAALAFHERDLSDDGSTAGRIARTKAFEHFDRSAEALRDYLSRSSTPPKWLACPFCGGEPCGSRVVGAEDFEILCTSCGVSVDGPSEFEATSRWNTRAPCLPPSSDTEVGKAQAEPITDAELQSFLLKLGAHDYPRPQIICLRAWLLETVGRKLEVAEQVYPSEISDDEIVGLAMHALADPIDYHHGLIPAGFNFSRRQLMIFARAILSKSHPTLSDNTLKQLFNLAKTEAWEQFRVDARGVVG